MSKANGHLPILDAARGLAAIAVLVYHLKDLAGGGVPVWGSFLAVDLFFLMSGYVIGLSYEERLRSGRYQFWDFARARVVRLYPLYLLACGIGFGYFLLKVVLHLDDAPSYPQLLGAVPPALVLVVSPSSSGWGFAPFPFAPSAWSLSFELWGNVIYAFLVVRLRSRYLVSLAAAALLVLIHQALTAKTVDLGYDVATMIGGLARFWLSFTVGLLLYRWRQRLQAMRLPSGAGLVMALAMAFPLLPRGAVAWDLVWIVIIFPAALVVAARYGASGLPAALCDHLGRLSYGIYILHAPLILLLLGVMKVALGEAWDDHPGVLVSGLVIAVVSVAAAATYFFDEPVRQRLRPRSASVGSMAGAER